MSQSRALVGDHFLYSRHLTFDSAVIMLGEISCQSLLGSKNLIIIILDKRDASLS